MYVQVFGVSDAYVPFVLFRRPKYTGGWAIKKIKLRLLLSSNQLDLIIREIVINLSYHRILPYHIYHVEHCVDCESHQNTTRHDPGSYER